MINWQKNNLAHIYLSHFETWYHHQKDVKFEPSGQWETSFLINSNTDESAQMRQDKAETHAEVLDDAFIGLFTAEYEEGVDRDKAIAMMVNVLINPNKKLQDLGDPIDDHYQFIGTRF